VYQVPRLRSYSNTHVLRARIRKDQRNSKARILNSATFCDDTFTGQSVAVIYVKRDNGVLFTNLLRRREMSVKNKVLTVNSSHNDIPTTKGISAVQRMTSSDRAFL
jgi:hypothetical protein